MIEARLKGTLRLVASDDFSELVSWKNRDLHLTEHYGSAYLDLGDKYIHPIIVAEEQPEIGDWYFNSFTREIGEFTAEINLTQDFQKVIVQSKNFTKRFLLSIMSEIVKDGDQFDVIKQYRLYEPSNSSNNWVIEYRIVRPNSWKPRNEQPPNERVEVRDKELNVGFADPTYYPFKIGKRPGDEFKQWGFRGTVVPSELNWDGGFLIQAEGLISPLKGDIVEWRLIENLNK